jgi:hypothetical protein
MNSVNLQGFFIMAQKRSHFLSRAGIKRAMNFSVTHYRPQGEATIHSHSLSIVKGTHTNDHYSVSLSHHRHYIHSRATGSGYPLYANREGEGRAMLKAIVTLSLRVVGIELPTPEQLNVQSLLAELWPMEDSHNV